jgi:hypothetical protein
LKLRQYLFTVGRAVACPASDSEPCHSYPQVTAVALTDRILRQGRALVRAIEALGTIEPTGPFERALARLLMAADERRLRAIVETTPVWVGEEILSISERGKAAPPFDFCPEWQYTMCV